MKWFFLLFSLHCQAAFLAWDANVETNVAGYRVYEGWSTRSYDRMYDVSNVIEWYVDKGHGGNLNFFAVTAYSTEGLESDYSDEVSWSRPFLSTPHLVLSNGIAQWEPLLEATNYIIRIESLTFGTNYQDNVNAFEYVLPGLVEGAWRVSLKAESSQTDSHWSTAYRRNLGLPVPLGKWNIDRSDTLATWDHIDAVEGPTTVWFPTDQAARFYRVSPYFVSAKGFKTGKLTTAPLVR